MQERKDENNNTMLNQELKVLAFANPLSIHALFNKDTPEILASLLQEKDAYDNTFFHILLSDVTRYEKFIMTMIECGNDHALVQDVINQTVLKQNKKGETPFHLLFSLNKFYQQDMVESLVELLHDQTVCQLVHLQEKDTQDTVVHALIKSKSAPLGLRVLMQKLNHKALNLLHCQQNKEGQTILLLASICWASSEVIELLLVPYLTPEIVNQTLPIENKHGRSLLLSTWAKDDPSFELIINMAQPAILKTLLLKKDKFGNSLFTIVIHQQRSSLAKLLGVASDQLINEEIAKVYVSDGPLVRSRNALSLVHDPESHIFKIILSKKEINLQLIYNELIEMRSVFRKVGLEDFIILICKDPFLFKSVLKTETSANRSRDHGHHPMSFYLLEEFSGGEFNPSFEKKDLINKTLAFLEVPPKMHGYSCSDFINYFKLILRSDYNRIRDPKSILAILLSGLNNFKFDTEPNLLFAMIGRLYLVLPKTNEHTSLAQHYFLKINQPADLRAIDHEIIRDFFLTRINATAEPLKTFLIHKSQCHDHAQLKLKEKKAKDKDEADKEEAKYEQEEKADKNEAKYEQGEEKIAKLHELPEDFKQTNIQLKTTYAQKLTQDLSEFKKYLDKRAKETRALPLFGFSEQDYTKRNQFYFAFNCATRLETKQNILKLALKDKNITGGKRQECADHIRTLLTDVNFLIQLENESLAWTPKLEITPTPIKRSPSKP